MKLILRYLKPIWGSVAVAMTIKSIGTIAELALPYILSYILGSIVVHEKISEILLWGGLMVACSVFACTLNVIANRRSELLTRTAVEKLRQDLFEKTIRLSAAQTDKFTIASLESRITTDTYNIRHFLGTMQRMGIRQPIMLIGGVIITLAMDAHLAVVMVAMVPIIFVVVCFISMKGVPLYTKVQHSVDGMTRVVREDVSGIRVIKALSKETYEQNRYDVTNKALVKDEKKANITMGLANPIMTLSMNLGIVVVVVLAAYRIQGGTSAPETVIAFMQYFTLISNALMGVTRLFVMYTKAEASSKRIDEVLFSEEDLKVADKSQYPDIETDKHIIFRNVSFSYEGKKNNLENINLEIERGGTLGVIGATGSGKSTLIKLLMRFYDVSDGAIYIDSEDLRTIPKEKLYTLFGSAMQNDFLYADTIEENIRFGRNLSHEEIVEAAKIAQADSFISAKKDGYESVLAVKGANLSGGQKQRVLISRAVASKPDILILDDSSSALDYKTDANLRKALAENIHDSTVITVAQRVSSVKSCDRILVLDDGEIIGYGTHDELMESCNEYREISESQMGGGFVE